MFSSLMRYKVPQNVQREDTILWFITLRQLVILLVGGGISYYLFVNLSKTYTLNQLELILVWLPAILAVTFAFVQIKHIPFFQFLLLLIEQTFFRAPRRYWQNNTDVFVSATQPFSMSHKKETVRKEKENVAPEKIRKIAAIVDKKNLEPSQ